MTEPGAIDFHLCPHCLRATPAEADERYCPNDGTRLLRACPSCGAAIRPPVGPRCRGCGRPFVAGGRPETPR